MVCLKCRVPSRSFNNILFVEIKTLLLKKQEVCTYRWLWSQKSFYKFLRVKSKYFKCITIKYRYFILFITLFPLRSLEMIFLSCLVREYALTSDLLMVLNIFQVHFVPSWGRQDYSSVPPSRWVKQIVIKELIFSLKGWCRCKKCFSFFVNSCFLSLSACVSFFSISFFDVQTWITLLLTHCPC